MVNRLSFVIAAVACALLAYQWAKPTLVSAQGVDVNGYALVAGHGAGNTVWRLNKDTGAMDLCTADNGQITCHAAPAPKGMASE